MQLMAHLLLVLLGTGACSGHVQSGAPPLSEAESTKSVAEYCARQHPREPLDAAGVASVEACKAHGGRGCDPARFISKQAALCIAQASMPAPVEAWSAELVFDSEEIDARTKWLVIATDELAKCCRPTWSFRIDATSGALLSEFSPMHVCCPEP